MFIDTPFHLSKLTGIAAQTDIQHSIKNFLNLLAATPQGSFKADTNFGFLFKNFRFQNFNEQKSTLYSNPLDEDDIPAYKKKIQGNSNNLNTFAYEFKQCIDLYEPRLKKVKVVMDYLPVSKTINMSITGETATEIAQPFSHNITIHIW